MEGVEVGRAGHGFPSQKAVFLLFGALPHGPSATSGGRREAPSSSRNKSKKVISVSLPQLESSRRNGPPASLPLPRARSLSGTPGAAGAQEPLPRPRARPGVRGAAVCCPLPGGGRGIPLLPRGSRARFAACREGSVRRAPRRAAPSPLPPGGSGQGRRREHVSRPGATEAPSAALGSPRHGDRQRGVSMTRSEPSPAMPASPLPVSRGTYVGRRVAFSFSLSPPPPPAHTLFILCNTPFSPGPVWNRGGEGRPLPAWGEDESGLRRSLPGNGETEGRAGHLARRAGTLSHSRKTAGERGRAAFSSSEGAASPRRAPGCGGSGPSFGPFVCPLQPRCGPWGHEEPRRACPCPALPGLCPLPQRAAVPRTATRGQGGAASGSGRSPSCSSEETCTRRTG